MAIIKVSALAAKTSLGGSEELLINDGGTSKKVTATNLLAGAVVGTGDITTAKIADDAVTTDKLANAINSAITANTAKTGITSGQTSAITANTAKVTNATHTGDVTGATALTIGTGKVITAMILDDNVTADKLANSINSEIAANTAKTGITSSQASAIVANTAKTGITSGQTSAITANTAKVTNATHSGEVTGATALTIADNVVDEANLKVNSPTNGYVLTAQSGQSGGLLWAEAASGNTTTNGLYEMANTIASNYTIGNNNNAISAGAITINSGVSVTVPSGSTWVIA